MKSLALRLLLVVAVVAALIAVAVQANGQSPASLLSGLRLESLGSREANGQGDQRSSFVRRAASAGHALQVGRRVGRRSTIQRRPGTHFAAGFLSPLSVGAVSSASASSLSEFDRLMQESALLELQADSHTESQTFSEADADAETAADEAAEALEDAEADMDAEDATAADAEALAQDSALIEGETESESEADTETETETEAEVSECPCKKNKGNTDSTTAAASEGCPCEDSFAELSSEPVATPADAPRAPRVHIHVTTKLHGGPNSDNLLRVEEKFDSLHDRVMGRLNKLMGRVERHEEATDE